MSIRLLAKAAAFMVMSLDECSTFSVTPEISIAEIVLESA
jgi:hypothetical protein